ncbi:MAG: hypothetical protein LUG18_14845 [Candidatus Azobacteroides sp.]|nr:hypothetical protein [Candidatus Azobacteroides sp.]
MKKLLLLSLFLSLLFACEGPRGPEGPPGTYMYAASFTVKEGDWNIYETSEPGRLEAYYYVNIEIPALTQYVFNNGIVLVYLQTGNGVKELLPSILNQGENLDTGEYFWTQTYISDYYYNSSTRKGGVGIYVVDSDFFLDFPGEQTFDIRIVWD